MRGRAIGDNCSTVGNPATDSSPTSCVMSRRHLSEPACFAIAFVAMLATFALLFGGQSVIRGIANQRAIRDFLRDENRLLEPLRNRAGVHEIRVSESKNYPGNVDVWLDVADRAVFNAVDPELDQILQEQKIRYRTDWRVRSAELPGDLPGRFVGELGGMFFIVLWFFFSVTMSLLMFVCFHQILSRGSPKPVGNG